MSDQSSSSVPKAIALEVAEQAQLLFRADASSERFNGTVDAHEAAKKILGELSKVWSDPALRTAVARELEIIGSRTFGTLPNIEVRFSGDGGISFIDFTPSRLDVRQWDSEVQHKDIVVTPKCAEVEFVGDDPVPTCHGPNGLVIDAKRTLSANSRRSSLEGNTIAHFETDLSIKRD